MRVHRLLGCGFLEIVYERALAIEFQNKEIQFTRQAQFPVTYGEQLLGTFVADYLIEDQLILELKATQGITPDCYSQLLNYLRASNINLGLLLNFGTPSLQIKRIANNFKPARNFKKQVQPIQKKSA